MAKPRQKESGRWEVTLRHPSLPGGRKAFSFDTEAEAATYEKQWMLMKLAGLQPPAELLKPPSKRTVILAQILRDWINSGLAAPTQHSPLGSLVSEVGSVRLEDVNYAWLSAYIQRLKVENNLAPGSIRHRVQALGRSLDEYMRHHPETVFANPIKLLPRGYSTYSDVDKRLALANGGKAKADVSRDRRLHPGEEEKIIAVLSGYQRPDRARALDLSGGNALLTMFLMIVYTGMRLREAYTLRRSQIDLDNKVIRVQCSKQWRGKIAFRDVPMRPEVHKALIHYLSTRSLLPSAYLFPFMAEPGMTLKKATQRLSDRFRIAFDYAGITDLHEHDLRHCATCRWLEMKDANGQWMWRMEEVNRILGWTPNSVMAQRYASFRGADMAQRMWTRQAPASGRG
jgi:integrase